MSTPSQEPKRKNWFDGTVNLPTIIAVVTTLAGTCYYGIQQINGLQNRVSLLEQRDAAQEDHFRRIEASQDSLRSEVLGQLRDLNNKIDQLILSGQVAGGYVRGPTYDQNQSRTRR